MRIKRFDNKTVRIEHSDGAIFEGPCSYNSREYNYHEFGRNDSSLVIDNWMFFARDIKSVTVIPESEEYIWWDRVEHRMKVDPKAFDMLFYGTKTIELRLYDEKKQRIKPGDVIRFESTADETDVFKASVEELFIFDTFEELYRSLPLLQCGYTEETIKDASPDDMDKYYSKEKQQKYRVVGIRVAEL